MLKNPIQPYNAAYEERLLVFIDILGWSRAILRSGTDEAPVPQLALPAAALESFVMDGRVETFANMKATLLSDTLAVSWIPEVETCWTRWYIHKVITLVEILFAFGYYARGAITYGKLFHDNAILFGPALLDAYNIEKNIAVFPRIVITDTAQPLLDGMQGEGLPAFVRNDSDGLRFLNAFAYIGRFAECRSQVIRWAERDKAETRISEKHQWMIRYLEDLERERKGRD